MSIRDILVIVTESKQAGPLYAAELLGAQWKAHIAALYASRMPDPVEGGLYFSGSIWAQAVNDIRKAAAADRQKLASRLAALEPPVELRHEEVVLGLAEDVASRHAMHADLTLLEQPRDEFNSGLFEGALFRSGRPVLLVSPNWKGGAIGKKILVAWKPKREAARAVADAAPFFADAEQVTVATVDAEPNGHGAAPGQDIAAHLARHAPRVELRNLDGLGQTAETALLSEAANINADLIVMGGYGHSRLRQFVFGGATRSLSREAPIPVFMSH